MSRTSRAPSRVLCTIALDVPIAVLLLVVVAIQITGGFDLALGGRHVLSAHDRGRSLLLLFVFAAIRLTFFTVDGQRAVRGASGIRQFATRLRAWADELARRTSTSPVPLWGRHTLFAFAGLCAFGVAFLYPQLRAMYSVPDLGDPLLSMWRMGWLFHWLHGDPRPLFSPNIFYPEPLTLTYSDSMLVPSLMGAPLLAMGLHPVVAYNVLFISGFILSGLAMYLLAVQLTGSPRAAFVSAVIFAFYPFRFEHYSHLELQMTLWMPLGLLALHRFITALRMRYAIGFALCGVAQLYSSMYFAVFFFLYVMPVAAVLLYAHRVPLSRVWRGAVIGGGLAAILAVPLARPYIEAQARKGDRNVEAVTVYSAKLKDYVSPNTRSIAYDGVLPHPDPERGLFPGFAALALTATALVPPLTTIRVAYTAGMLLAFEASRGFHGITYPYLYEWFPPIRGMRVPARFSMVVGMTLAILAGFGVLRLLGLVRSHWRHAALFGVLMAALFLDLRSHLHLVPVWREPPAVYRAIEGQPGVVLAEFPWWSDRSDIAEQMPLMYFSLWHWANMVNGSSGFEPPRYQQFLEDIHLFPQDNAVDALKARGVTHVTINCALYGEERDCHGVLDTLDASSRFQPLAAARWEGDSVKLYKLLQ